jgi:hypothetical protein
VLDYRRSVPPRDLAKFLRFFMLVVAIFVILAAAALLLNPVLELGESLGGGILGTPFAPINGTLSDENIQKAYWFEALVYLGIFLLMQWLFLSPRGRWRIGLSLEGPPPRRAALAAGFIGMLLSIGLFATLMEIPDWWMKLTTVPPAANYAHRTQHFGIFWIVMLADWAVWTLVFWSYWKSLDRYSALQKIFRWLVAGTVLELAISVPAHAIVVQARGGDCYCERGTWTGVAFGATAAFWLFGPGAFLLFLREKQRRERFD